MADWTRYPHRADWAGISGPLVLVGHSIGAVFARMHAGRYGTDAQGMMLSDHAGRYRFPNVAGMLRSEEQTLRKLPPAAQEMHRQAARRPGASTTGRSAIPFYNPCIAEVGKTTAARPDPLGNKPLVVVANGYLAASEDYQTAQAGLLGLSHNSKALVAPNSGHDVPMEDADVLVRAIREVVDAIRTRAHLH